MFSEVCKALKRYLSVEARLSLKAGMGNVRMGMRNGEWGTGNGESLKWGMFKTGNL